MIEQAKYTVGDWVCHRESGDILQVCEATWDDLLNEVHYALGTNRYVSMLEKDLRTATGYEILQSKLLDDIET